MATNTVVQQLNMIQLRNRLKVVTKNRDVEVLESPTSILNINEGEDPNGGTTALLSGREGESNTGLVCTNTQTLDAGVMAVE